MVLLGISLVYLLWVLYIKDDFQAKLINYSKFEI